MEMTESKSMLREGSSAMNLGLAKDGSTGVRAEAVMLGEMDHRGSYDWGMPTGSSVGAMGSDSRGGQPTGPQPGWSRIAHRGFPPSLHQNF
jgi:hypothetical protein